MPYIDSTARKHLEYYGYDGSDRAHARVSGELNYQITMCLKEYVAAHGLCYQTINDIVGALEGAKLEFYRRVAVPYEESKIKANGDVY